MNWDTVYTTAAFVFSIAAVALSVAAAVSARRDYRRAKKSRDESALLLIRAKRLERRLHDQIGIQERQR